MRLILEAILSTSKGKEEYSFMLVTCWGEASADGNGDRIHMLPLLPNSAYARKKAFVTEEWNAMFAQGATKPANQVEGGWRGVLFANLAIINPSAAWNFFAQGNFNMGWIDGGATRTWYLAYAAGKL